MMLLEPIGIVKNARLSVEDDNWGSLVSSIELCAPYNEESLRGIDDFSHVEVIFYFHQVSEKKNCEGSTLP